MNVLYHLAVQHAALVILLQEILCTSSEQLKFISFALAGYSLSRKHSLATFASKRLKYTLLKQSPLKSETEWLCVDVDEYKIVNVYKLQPTRLQVSDLPLFLHSCFYAGDYNCLHTDWGYDANNVDGKCLAGWASINSLAFLHNPKGSASFYAGRWNSSTNPYFAFASADSDGRSPGRRVPEKISSSQHRSLIITPPRLALPTPSMPVKRWNFHKGKWSHYISLTNKFAKTLLPSDSPGVDQAYQDFCKVISSVAKRFIPRGRRNNHIPCLDSERANLYRVFLQFSDGNNSSRASRALLTRLDRKRRDRCFEAA